MKIINTLRKIWTFLNGKKMYLGTFIYFVALQLQMNGLVNTQILNQITGYVATGAAILAYLGIGHKIVKWLDKPIPSEQAPIQTAM